MIQRPQTLLLLGAVIALTLTLFFPFVNMVTENSTIHVTALGVKELSKAGEVLKERSMFYIVLLPIISIGMALFTIFKYDNRLLQMKLCAVNNLIMAGYLILISIFAMPEAEKLLSSRVVGISYNFAFFLPAVAVVLNIVAKWLIRKDDKLVKSVDRIR